MSYVDNFTHADELIAHLDTVVPGITTPLLQAKYTGFVSVAAVTVYELAIKEIFIGFGAGKHKILGNFTEAYFHRINGRIKIRVVKEDYINKFGQKYVVRFDKKVTARANDYLRSTGRDIRSAYNNLITWRNDFAHAGKLNTTATYKEATQAYADGKEEIHVLADVMRR